MAVQIKPEIESESEYDGYRKLTGEKPMFMKTSVEDGLENKVKFNTTSLISQVPDDEGCTGQDQLDNIEDEPAEDPNSSEQITGVPQGSDKRKRGRNRTPSSGSSSKSSDELEVLKKKTRTGNPTDENDTYFKTYFAKKGSQEGLVMGDTVVETNPKPLVGSGVCEGVPPFTAFIQPIEISSCTSQTSDKGNESEVTNTKFLQDRKTRGKTPTSTANKVIDGKRPKDNRNNSKTTAGKNRPKDNGNKHSTKRIRSKKPATRTTYAAEKRSKSNQFKPIDDKKTGSYHIVCGEGFKVNIRRRKSPAASTTYASKRRSKSKPIKPIDDKTSHQIVYGEGLKVKIRRRKSPETSSTYANDSFSKSTPNEAMDGKRFPDIVKGKNGRSDLSPNQNATPELAHSKGRYKMHRSDLPAPLLQKLTEIKHPTENQKLEVFPILIHSTCNLIQSQIQNCTDTGTSLNLKNQDLLQPATKQHGDISTHSLAKRNQLSVSTTPLSQGLPDLYKLEITDREGTLADPNEDQMQKERILQGSKLIVSEYLQGKGSNN